MSENVKELVQGIKKVVTQTSSSKKDEVSVMTAMLNDRNYKVDIYGSHGQEGSYCPGKDFRNMISSVVAETTHIEKREAESLVEGFDFHRSHGEAVVNVAKEFINTYVETGRKIKLGGRETSDVSLSLKESPAAMRPYPTQIGSDADGKPVYGRGEVWVGGYKGIKAASPCPSWVKNKKPE